MKKLHIDLALRLLPPDHPVYMVRPGAGYHLHHATLSNHALAPDFPFLNIENGSRPSSAKNLEAMLSRAVVIRSWGSTPTIRRGAMPTTQIDAYRLGQEESAANKTRLLNVAEAVLWELPKDSLIFVPADSLSGNAMTGELGGNQEKRMRFFGTGHRRKIEYLGRPIHDAKRHAMRALPDDVTDRAHERTAIVQYEGYARDRLLRAHYGDYQLGDDVAMMEFVSNSDRFDTATMARITALATSIDHFVKTGKFVEPGELLFGHKLATTSHVHATINSKDGKLLIEAEQVVPHVIRALVLASVFTLGAGAEQSSSLLEKGNLEVTNSKTVDGQAHIVEAAENTLIDFARAAGKPSLKDLLTGLSDSYEASNGEVDGTAEIK